MPENASYWYISMYRGSRALYILRQIVQTEWWPLENQPPQPEKFGIGIGIGFKTFPIFFIVSDSALKIFGIKISVGFGIGKKLVSKKVFDSVSEIFGIEKSIGFGIGKNLI